ncbi:MAG: winged helix-turn-helix domain-containing protein, partial [Pseudomonadota bacterium]
MVYEFADFVLDEERFTLTDGSGAAVPLQTRALELLLLLVRNAGSTVSKDTILREIWGRENVSRSALPTQVLNLRRALGDTEEPYKLIQTVTRKGLRFCGELTPGHKSEELAILADAAALPQDFEYASAEPIEYHASPYLIGQPAPKPQVPTTAEAAPTPTSKSLLNQSRYGIAALVAAVLIAMGIIFYASPFDEPQA